MILKLHININIFIFYDICIQLSEYKVSIRLKYIVSILCFCKTIFKSFIQLVINQKLLVKMYFDTSRFSIKSVLIFENTPGTVQEI